MPTPSKFTAEVRAEIIRLVRDGHSRAAAARLAGVHPAQLSRWLARSERSAEGSRFHAFAAEVLRAEALCTGDMVEIVRRDAVVERNAKSAMWWLDRRVPEFRRRGPEPDPPPEGPVVIQLSFHDGTPLSPLPPPHPLPDGDEPA